MIQDTYTLVQKLSPLQRDFVRQYATLYSQGRSSHYIALFEALLELPQWNVEQLQHMLQNHPLLARLAHTANYLEALVLRCLRHQPHEPAQLHQRLCQVGILATKGLLPLAQQQLAQLETELQEMEDYEQLCRVARYAQWLQERAPAPKTFAATAGRLPHYAAVATSESQLLQLATTVGRIISNKYFYELPPASQQKLMEVLQLPVVTNPTAAPSTHARMLQLSIQEKILNLTDPPAMLRVVQQQVELMESKPALSARQRQHLMNAYDGLLVRYEAEELLHLYEPVLNKMLVLQGAHPVQETYFRCTKSLHALPFYAKKGDALNLGRYLQFTYQTLEQHSNNLRPSSSNMLYCTLAMTCLQAGRYAEAVDVINTTISKNEKEFRPDVLATVRQIQFMAHYLLGNADILDSLYRSSLRFTTAHSQRLDVDQVLYQLFRKLAQWPAERETQKALQKALQQLQELKDQHQTRDLCVFGFWKTLLSALLQKTPLPQYLKTYYTPLLTPPNQP